MPTVPRRDVTQRTKQVLGREQGRPWQVYRRADELIKDLGFSPVTKLSLTGPLNKEFSNLSVTVSDDEVSAASTIGDLSDLVWSKLLEVTQ